MSCITTQKTVYPSPKPRRLSDPLHATVMGAT